MKKDYLAFNNYIFKAENLSLEEGYMMQVLFQFHNEALGYAYPSYKTLMQHCKTNRQAKVSKILKSLADKGFIVIEKHGNNRYFITNINQFLQGSNNISSDDEDNSNNENNNDNTSNNSNSEFEGLTLSQENTLMRLAKTKERLKEIIDYSRNKAKNLFAYCYKLLKDNIIIGKKDNIQVNTSYSYANNNTYSNNSTPRYNGFNNFKAREYDYDALERQLLGWE